MYQFYHFALLVLWVGKYVDCCIGSLQNLILQYLHPFHTTWGFLVTSTFWLVYIPIHTASQTGSKPMIKWSCRPRSMWAVLTLFRKKFTRISNSCKFVNFDPPTMPTVIGMFSGTLFSLGDVGRRYMYDDPLSDTTTSLSLFYIFFCGWGIWISVNP